MTDADSSAATTRPTRERSPSFPFIPLGTAVERLEKFDEKFGRHPVPAKKAGLAWGMKEGSSQAYQTLAALKSFGFIDYSGSGDERVAFLTNEARRYLRAQQDSIKRDVIVNAALKPKQVQKFWSDWRADPPPDEIRIDDLIFNHNFTEPAARTFLRVYDETIEFAGLSGAEAGEDGGEADSPNGERGEDFSDQDRGSAPHVPPTHQQRKTAAGQRRDVLSLNEGEVSLTLPGELSPESFQDLSDWLELIKRKAERSVKR